MPIRLITVAGAHTAVLRDMLTHYRSLGVDELIIHAHAPSCDDAVLPEVRRVAEDLDAEIASVNVGPWLTTMNSALYALSRADRPDDWFILADQDELQVYPDDLRSIISHCDRNGYTYIEGALIDRISETGRLDKIAPAVPVWEQFPLGSIISARLLHSVINKVVVVKGRVMLADGQHRAYSGFGCPPGSIYVPVHHFKWTEGIDAQLERRIALNRRLRPLHTDLYTIECERFLAYYRENGFFRVDDPELMIAPCKPDYPYWEKIREWRISASYFSEDLAINTQARTPALACSNTLPVNT